jgi:glycosyltransferase involved in cell wall biosynthesis
LKSSKSDGALRICMLGLYGMPLENLHFTGFETGFGEIAPRLVQMGHEVTIYCRGSHYPDALRVPEYKGVKLKFVPSPGGKNLSGLVATLIASLHALLFGRYDVFFFVNVGMGHHAALCRVMGATVVMNVDGLDWTRAKWGPLAKLYFRTAARSAIHFCNRLVTDAWAMQKFYLDEFDKETTMIAYGAYVESAENPDVVRQFGVEPDGYYLIASRLIPENHADLITEAFAGSGTRKKLLIAGGANYDSPFHRRLRELATENVIFTGHIHDQAVIKELHCNCFAYVHGHSVGGTNPSLLKAMGYGNCVLALDTVFNREVLADTGLFFPKDATALAQLMQRVEREPDLVGDLRARAPRRIATEYTWDGVSRQYDDLFREVAGARVKSD